MVESQTSGRNALHDLGYKIFLDRYAQKDMTRASLAEGDTVIVVVDANTGQREIGIVTQLALPEVTITLKDGQVVTRDVEHVDKPLETQPEQMMDRVAAGVAAQEATPELQRTWAERFRWLLDDWKFVPGGRILTAAGTDQNLTYYNCMPPDQEVLTSSGYKPIADVQVGDLVVTHRNRLRPVLHKFERETVEPIYVIRPRKVSYDDLRVTGDHKILIIRNEWVNTYRSRDGLRLQQEPTWVPAKDIKPGDYVALAYNGEVEQPNTICLLDYIGVQSITMDEEPVLYSQTPHSAYVVQGSQLKKTAVDAAGATVALHGRRPAPLNNELLLDADLCYVFGRWLGDGCVTHRTGTDIPSGVKIVFNLQEVAEAERIADIIEAKFGVKPDLKLSSTTRWYDLWVNSMPVGEFFKGFLGAYSHSKRIHDVLMQLSDELTLALLRGLFQADGYISDKYLGVLLANRVLATQVHQLLMRLGYLFSIKENTHKNGRTPAFRLTGTVSDCEALFEAFFDQAAPANDTTFKYYIEYDGLKWVRIDSIAIEDYEGTVLDLEVEEDHSFVSAGVVVSNCYVVPSPKDSREGIMTTLTQMTEIMSRGGGVGINLSTLRPRHAYVKGVNGRSSGSVSWGALYSFVTGLIEQGGCFGPQERIATDKGLISAEELADRMDSGETFRAHTHQGLRGITARFRNGRKLLYEMRTVRGYSVKITEDHKVAVFMDGRIETMALKYLQTGDEILLLLGDGTTASDYLPLQTPAYDRSIMSTRLNEDVTLPTHLDETLAYVLGYMHGDGYVHIGKKVTWEAPKAVKMATANAHPSIRTRLIDAVKALFGISPTLEDGDGACCNIAVYSRVLIEWLIHNGLLKAKSADVRVPEAIFRSPSSVVGAFIAGYFDADGCDHGHKGGYGIDSISRKMLEDVQQLLAANGIVSHIHTQERSGNWQDIHRLSVTGAPFKARFAGFVPAEKVSGETGKRDMYNTYPVEAYHALGIRSKYRQRIYDGYSPRISYSQLGKIRQRLADEGQVAVAAQLDDIMHVMPDTIASITPVGESDVYDFEVDDVHLLSGNGIYTSNSRRGALMLILNDWHPDIFDFVNSKREAGKITNANISVGVSDKLMEAVKADADWQLLFPDTSDPDYDDLWDGDLDTWMAAGRKVLHYKTIKARDLWNAIIESAWASAEPGVWFRERSNKMANSWYFNPLIATNPCHAGSNLIHTRNGLIPIRDLVGKEFEVVSDLRTMGGAGVQYERAVAYPTGKAQLYEVKLKTGQTIELTANHAVFTQRGKVAVQDLKIGEDVILIQSAPHLDALLELDDDLVQEGRIVGWNAGDGWVSQFPETHQGTGVNVGFIFNEQEQPARDLMLDFVNTQSSSPRPINARMNSGCWEIQTSNANTVAFFESYGITPKTRKRVTPEIFAAPVAFRIGFLQGLFSADGHIGEYKHSKTGNILLITVNKSLAKGVQLLLSDLGIKTHLGSRSGKGMQYVLSDGTVKTSRARVAYSVRIAGAEGRERFARLIGFPLSTKKQARLEKVVTDIQDARKSYVDYWSEVVSVRPTKEGLIYNLTTDISHALIANGFVVANCGEQPLGEFSVCNLGAINLARFYDETAHDVDWESLRQTVRYATRFLDNIIDSTPYFFEENRTVQLGERRVGLGTMGIAELMIQCGIRYGSDASVQFIDRVYEAIATTAYETSTELAQEKGAFPQFDAEKYLESGYMLAMPERVRKLVETRGIRNVTLLTQAPTGTTGTMVNTSTGVEPFFSWVYYRKSRLGLHEEQVPIVKDWYAANPDAETLPDFFVTAMELSPDEHVRVQAAFQRWIDSAISKTSNVPNHYTVEQVSQLYQYMYDLGCKGGTIYRDGSRDEQVLMLKPDEPTQAEASDAKSENAPAAKAATATTPANEPKAEPERVSTKPSKPQPTAPKADASDKVTQVATPHRVYPRPRKLQGVTTSTKSPFGTAYITMNSDEMGNPFEVFITVGKAGSDVQADAEGLGRMLSLALRTTAPHNRMEMLKLIIDQLEHIGGSSAVGIGPNRVLSLPDAVAQALRAHYLSQDMPQQLGLPMNGHAHDDNDEDDDDNATPMLPVSTNAAIVGADMCPSCGTASLVRAEGCRKCLTCDYSEC